MRLIVTADLHYNHPKSKALSDKLIDEINATNGDVLLVIGDTSVADGDALEQCLPRFRFAGPKLFVAGNHELWTRGENSQTIFERDLPKRVYDLGWQWLQTQPFVSDDRQVAIVGSIGWYDYSFAVPQLEIPRRFYAAKISPGAAERLGEFEELFGGSATIPPHAMEIVARWNDGKFIKLHKSDDGFLDELLSCLKSQLDALSGTPKIVAAIHHVPFQELLPPRHGSQWDFVRAYLGSKRMGELLKHYRNVRTVLCGHSHFAVEAMIGDIRAINIGSGYRSKVFRVLEL